MVTKVATRVIVENIISKNGRLVQLIIRYGQRQYRISAGPNGTLKRQSVQYLRARKIWGRVEEGIPGPVAIVARNRLFPQTPQAQLL